MQAALGKVKRVAVEAVAVPDFDSGSFLTRMEAAQLDAIDLARQLPEVRVEGID